MDGISRNPTTKRALAGTVMILILAGIIVMLGPANAARADDPPPLHVTATLPLPGTTDRSTQLDMTIGRANGKVCATVTLTDDNLISGFDATTWVMFLDPQGNPIDDVSITHGCNAKFANGRAVVAAYRWDFEIAPAEAREIASVVVTVTPGNRTFFDCVCDAVNHAVDRAKATWANLSDDERAALKQWAINHGVQATGS